MNRLLRSGLPYLRPRLPALGGIQSLSRGTCTLTGPTSPMVRKRGVRLEQDNQSTSAWALNHVYDYSCFKASCIEDNGLLLSEHSVPISNTPDITMKPIAKELVKAALVAREYLILDSDPEAIALLRRSNHLIREQQPRPLQFMTHVVTYLKSPDVSFLRECSEDTYCSDIEKARKVIELGILADSFLKRIEKPKSDSNKFVEIKTD